MTDFLLPLLCLHDQPQRLFNGGQRALDLLDRGGGRHAHLADVLGGQIVQVVVSVGRPADLRIPIYKSYSLKYV